MRLTVEEVKELFGLSWKSMNTALAEGLFTFDADYIYSRFEDVKKEGAHKREVFYNADGELLSIPRID